MTPLRRISRIVGIIVLSGFMFAPTFPNVITGWDSVSSWDPGIFLFFHETFEIVTTISEQLSFARQVAASPENYQGDGLEASVIETTWIVFQHALIIAGAVVMIFCAFKNSFSRMLAWGMSVVMTFALLAFFKVYIVESQTYVGGAFHIGAGSYLWILSCVALLIKINTNIEPGAAPNGGSATQLGNSGGTEGPPSVI